MEEITRKKGPGEQGLSRLVYVVRCMRKDHHELHIESGKLSSRKAFEKNNALRVELHPKTCSCAYGSEIMNIQKIFSWKAKNVFKNELQATSKAK